MIRRVLTVLVLAGVSLVPAARGSAASEVTCRGVPATIVATAGAVSGTSGDDVIVISGTVLSVDAGAGADLICLGGVAAAIRGEAGDDTVDTTQNGTYPSWTTLGPGSNTFVGGPGEDRVDVGGAPESPSDDTVDTGAGDDVVDVVGPSSQLAVRTGGGMDTLRLSNNLPPGSFDLQGGANRIDVMPLPLAGGAQEVAVDLMQHVVRVSGQAMTWSGRVSQVLVAAKRVDLRGDGRPNQFLANGCRVTMRGRGGDDRLTMAANKANAVTHCPRPRVSRQLGGAGDDVLSGLSGPDLLVGGPGVDTAYGLAGRDSCTAERERRCES